jgi:hypothetical protein
MPTSRTLIPSRFSSETVRGSSESSCRVAQLGRCRQIYPRASGLVFSVTRPTARRTQIRRAFQASPVESGARADREATRSVLDQFPSHTLLDLRATFSQRAAIYGSAAAVHCLARAPCPACAIGRWRSWTTAFFSPISSVSLRPSYANGRTRLEADLASVGYANRPRSRSSRSAPSAEPLLPRRRHDQRARLRHRLGADAPGHLAHRRTRPAPRSVNEMRQNQRR